MAVSGVFLRRAAIAAALLCAVGASAREEVEERYCIVKGFVGAAQVRQSPNYKKVRREKAVNAASAQSRALAGITDQWTDVRIGMVVGEKCEVRTGAESEVRFETTEGSLVKVGENSLVEIAMLRAVKRTAKSGGKQEVSVDYNAKYKVTGGSVIANIKKMAHENPNIKFEAPTATAAIRGTTVEIEAKKGANTVIRAFDGTVLVAPAGTQRFVELGHGKMAEVAPKQKAIFVKDVPKDYKRKGFLLKGEKDPAEEAKAAAQKAEVAVKLRLDLGDSVDTVSCYAKDTITVEGLVQPAGAKVSVNGMAASPDKNGAFRLSFVAPPDSGVFLLNVTAENEKLTETVIRAVKVAHVHSDVKLATPAEGEVVTKPAIHVSGTAEPGSRVNVLGVTLTVKRDGTFSGEVGLPPKEGSVKVQVEIVDKENNAVWIERNIRYKK